MRQVRVGSLRWAGWLLVTLVFIILLVGSLSSILGKGYYTHLPERIFAACLLLLLIGVMTTTATQWAKWIFPFLGYLDIKSMFILLLGKRLSYPPVVAPRVLTAEYLLIFLSATVLTFRYMNHKPTKADAIGLVSLIVGVGCGLVLDSDKPMLLGTAALGLVQMTHLRGLRRRLNLTQINW